MFLGASRIFNIPIKMLASSLEKNVPTYLCENLQIIRMQKSLTSYLFWHLQFNWFLRWTPLFSASFLNAKKVSANWSGIGPELIKKIINYWCNIKSNHSFPFFIAFCPINNPKCWFGYFQIGNFNLGLIKLRNKSETNWIFSPEGSLFHINVQ